MLFPEIMESFFWTRTKQTEGSDVTNMNEIKIYIGLNDSDTQKQLFETDKYIDILKKVCRSYKTPFRILQQRADISMKTAAIRRKRH